MRPIHALAASGLILAAALASQPTSAQAQTRSYPPPAERAPAPDWGYGLAPYSRPLTSNGRRVTDPNDPPGWRGCDPYWDGESCRARDVHVFERPGGELVYDRSYARRARGAWRDADGTWRYDPGYGYGYGSAERAWGRDASGAPLRDHRGGRDYGRDPELVAWCRARYRSYEPATGYFTGYDGVRRFCG